MKLEDEIGQTKPFPNEWEKAFVNIIYTAYRLNYDQYQSLKRYGLTVERYNVLRILKGQDPEPASINLIKERMLNKMSNASRIVESLEKMELVERRPCDQDRRQRDVMITPKGKELLKEIARNSPGAKGNYGHIPEEDVVRLNEILDRFRDP